jgi:hypothetical protein
MEDKMKRNNKRNLILLFAFALMAVSFTGRAFSQEDLNENVLLAQYDDESEETSPEKPTETSEDDEEESESSDQESSDMTFDE